MCKLFRVFRELWRQYREACAVPTQMYEEDDDDWEHA